MNRRMTEVHVNYIIQLERAGRTSASDVLADAKTAESPLHDLYDWDVEKAAEAHWLDRTREIIRLVKVVVHTENISVSLPRYVRDPSAAAKEQGYVSVESLRLDPVLARRALIAEFERVTGSLRRARSIAVGLDLEDEVDALLARVVGLRALLSEPDKIITAEVVDAQTSVSV